MLLDLLDIIYISYIFYIYIYIKYIYIYISFQQEKYDRFLIKSSRVQTCEEKTLKINDMHKKKNKVDIVTNMIIIWNLTKQITKNVLLFIYPSSLQGCATPPSIFMLFCYKDFCCRDRYLIFWYLVWVFGRTGCTKLQIVFPC